MSKKKVAGITVACAAAVIVVVAVITALPEPEREGVPGSVWIPVAGTHDCAARTQTSLTAQGEVMSEGRHDVTRRGFQYVEGDSGDLPDIIPLVNPSFEYGIDAPVGWTPATGCTSARSTDKVKVGSYSLRVAGREADGQHWTYQILRDMSHFEGEYVTFGAWLWCDTPDRLRLGLRALDEGGTQLGVTFSARHPGDSQWHWISVAREMDVGVDRISVDIQIPEGTVISGYADGAILVQGAEVLAVFEDGEFAAGIYCLDIAALEHDIWYVIRAFAENAAGIGYGAVITCKTGE